MQFVIGGPDLPDPLLQAHEEGRVVFFCGAGISYLAGLPSYKELVERIYQQTGTKQSDIERKAFELGRFDATLDLLEQRLPGKRLEMREALLKSLRPRLRRKNSTLMQAALLRLARNREGALRLVTTNFDRVFHAAARQSGQPFQSYAAPSLPIPKNSRWDGLVHLHGLLPEKPDETALNRLVVTSGDFGLAYLVERWASRFLGELFRNYVVCFVGYSIEDPVMRYMMDALAADRVLGEFTPQAWALGACETGQERREGIQWRAKGVVPILYDVPTGSRNHSALHKTLEAWANIYRDGVQGKERIVVEHALARPQDSTQQDDFVGRMLWALSDKSGLPAKRFADFCPAPSLEWLLSSLADERFQHGDLPRFCVSPCEDVDAKLRFSLVRRPTPYRLAPPMLLATGYDTGSQWDNVMSQLARWLVRYLNDPRLVIWIVQHGGQVHRHWSGLIEARLSEIFSAEREGRTAELDAISSQAPQAIPSPQMRKLWRLILSGRVRSSIRDDGLYHWFRRLKQESLTTTLRLELRDMLAPKVVFSKALRWGKDEENVEEIPSTRHLVDSELVLAADNVDYTLRELGDERWTSTLPDLLEDFQQLLRDALDLMRELGAADDRDDQSHWHLPSIEPHWQNRGYRDWVSLIELLRAAWVEVRSRNISRATQIAQAWIELPYATFKRLALFAASKDNVISTEQWVGWLLNDGGWWLWSPNTTREACRLLVLQGKQLRSFDQARLENAILAGPPREMYRSELEHSSWENVISLSVWLRLAKLRSSGLTIGASAATRWAELSASFPQWKLSENERDEFSHWMSGTGDPDFKEIGNVDIAPRRRGELVEWLKNPPPGPELFHADTWPDRCRDRFFHSLGALCDLAQSGLWPAHRWREALQTWAEESFLLRSWRYAGPVVLTMPDATLQEIAHAVSWWMEAVSRSIQSHETILLDLCRRVLALPLDKSIKVTRDGEQIDQPVLQALNHPVGHVTQALINLWFKGRPSDNNLLPADIKPLFTHICNVEISRFRHGRVHLSSNLIALFRVDRNWTEKYLLPLFDWSKSWEAKAAWEGFLRSPRIYQPLLTAFKAQLLETANHYTELGEHREQFAAFLTYAALGPTEGYSYEEFRLAVSAFPQDGLERSVRSLAQSLEGAGDQRKDYWQNRVKPFWQHVWPKSRDLAVPRIVNPLVQLAIAAGPAFPDALDAVRHWLKPTENAYFAIHVLLESGLCMQFPIDALALLNAVIDNRQQWLPAELGQCLQQMETAAPDIATRAEYLRLMECLRRQAP